MEYKQQPKEYTKDEWLIYGIISNIYRHGVYLGSTNGRDWQTGEVISEIDEINKLTKKYLKILRISPDNKELNF